MDNGTEIPTLTEFLLARTAEDEAVARAVIGDNKWRAGEWSWTSGSVDVSGSDGEPCVYDDGPWVVVAKADRLAGAQVARHDPARVLADCEWKRQVVEERVALDERMAAGEELDQFEHGIAVGLQLVLRAWVVQYANHQDYREEWLQ